MSATVQHQMPWQAGMSLKTPLVCDRCFLGGPLNVRGFRMFGAGPHSDSASLGAGASLAYSAHLYSPMPGIRRTGGIGQYLRLHGFLTAGHVGEFQGESATIADHCSGYTPTVSRAYFALHETLPKIRKKYLLVLRLPLRHF
jgi:outer membrane protein insertion porin family